MHRGIGWAVVSLVTLTALAGCQGTQSTPDGGVSNKEASFQVVTRNAGHFATPHNADVVFGQDGNGAWQTLSGTDGLYSFPVTNAGGRFAVWIVCPTAGSAREGLVLEATLAELPLPALPCLVPDPLTTVQVTTQTTSPPTGTVSAPGFVGSTSFNSAVGTKSAPSSLPTGVYDVVFTALAGDFTELGLYLRHNQVVTQNTDFVVNLSSAAVPVKLVATVTSTLPPATTPSFQVSLSSPNGVFGITEPAPTGASSTLGLFPGVALDDGDLQSVLTTVNATGPDSVVAELDVGRELGSLNISLPSLLSASVTVDSTDPLVKLAYHWTGGPAAPGLAFLASQTQAVVINWVSPGYLGAAAEWTMPDPSAASGWQPDFGLAKGVPVTWLGLNAGGGAAGWRQAVRILPMGLGFTEPVAAVPLSAEEGMLTP